MTEQRRWAHEAAEAIWEECYNPFEPPPKERIAAIIEEYAPDLKKSEYFLVDSISVTGELFKGDAMKVEYIEWLQKHNLFKKAVPLYILDQEETDK